MKSINNGEIKLQKVSDHKLVVSIWLICLKTLADYELQTWRPVYRFDQKEIIVRKLLVANCIYSTDSRRNNILRGQSK